MKLHQKTICALELLYGGTEVPVCAVDETLRLLWASCVRAEELLHLLGMQLCEGSGQIRIPEDSTVLLHNVSPPMHCHVQTLLQEGARYYLLRFLPLSARRSLTPGEMQAIIEEQAEICSSAAALSIQSFQRIERRLKSLDSNMDTTVLKMHYKACYSLLNIRTRCRELLGYTLEQDNLCGSDPVDIGGVLDRAVEELRHAVPVVLPLASVRLAPALFAAVDPTRLHAAFLLLLTRLLMEDDIAAPSLAVEAAREADCICIRLTLQPYEAQDAVHRAFSRGDAGGNGTLLADYMLLRRFCDRYHGSFTIPSDKKDHTAELRLPAVSAPERLSLHSQTAFYECGCFTLTHILLSSVISPECFFESREDDSQ